MKTVSKNTKIVSSLCTEKISAFSKYTGFLRISGIYCYFSTPFCRKQVENCADIRGFRGEIWIVFLEMMGYNKKRFKTLICSGDEGQ